MNERAIIADMVVKVRAIRKRRCGWSWWDEALRYLGPGLGLVVEPTTGRVIGVVPVRPVRQEGGPVP